MAAAEEAEIGLGGGEWLVAYADYVRKMMRFAAALTARSGALRAARKRRPAAHQLGTPGRNSVTQMGKKCVDDLCRLWKEKRAADKMKTMDGKLVTFSSRRLSLPGSEQRTVRRAC